MNVTVYTKSNCSYCSHAKKLLKDKQIPFSELKLNEDFTRDFIVESFPGATTYPIVVIDGFNVGGYNELKEYLTENTEQRKFLTE